MTTCYKDAANGSHVINTSYKDAANELHGYSIDTPNYVTSLECLWYVNTASPNKLQNYTIISHCKGFQLMNYWMQCRQSYTGPLMDPML